MAWIARNLVNDSLVLFELEPKRFHSGPDLDPTMVGFNEAVRVDGGKDKYSFWAHQTYYNSNELEQGDYGISLYETGVVEDGKILTYKSYEPEDFKNLKWEDKPVEVEIILKNKS